MIRLLILLWQTNWSQESDGVQNRSSGNENKRCQQLEGISIKTILNSLNDPIPRFSDGMEDQGTLYIDRSNVDDGHI